MNFIKKVYRKLCDTTYRITRMIKIILQSFVYKNKVYLFGIPIHGNLGDQAILLAEEKFLQNNLEDIKIIEVESGIVLRFKKILKKLVGQDVILVHGGGFLGTLWIREEKMFRTILNVFHDNTIIVLPQTAYFSEDEEGKRILEESIELYQEKFIYLLQRGIFI